MKILHIVNWYPSKPAPFSAPWIQNHINSISKYSENVVYHIEIRKGGYKLNRGINEDGSNYFIMYFPFEIWKIFEIFSFITMLIVIIKNRNVKFNIINFHIAYPNLTYFHIIRKWIKIPIVITEHWSAYHYNFRIRYPAKRRRIQKIFQNNIPVIAVSKSLLKDIKVFSKANFPSYVIPNIVNTDLFNYQDNASMIDNRAFFMVSQWKWPKDPFTIIKAWKEFIGTYPKYVLRIGGYGHLWNEMIELTKILKLQNHIEFLGYLPPENIASEMRNSTAFIHCSDYETFSVVCAEALCCGTPVIASNVGGIGEYMNKKNSVLVISNTKEAFKSGIISLIENLNQFNRAAISQESSNKFSAQKVGFFYNNVLEKIIHETK